MRGVARGYLSLLAGRRARRTYGYVFVLRTQCQQVTTTPGDGTKAVPAGPDVG